MLADTIVNGRPGTPMPPFSGLVDDDEARWLVERLMEGLPAR
jgi:cytochrome c55X